MYTYLAKGLISGFRNQVDGICALLRNYAAYSGNSVPTFRDKLTVPKRRKKNCHYTLFKGFHNSAVILMMEMEIPSETLR